ncbi:MAG TPA: protein kinase [Candidatus Saccharimonadales bacterium]|nr:protein kinase [Candidatus Saccharimonadales bacterium]
MTLEPGQSLAHYRLVSRIGEGGMGVVWRAEDTRLGRPVAIKVLPEEVSRDPQRLARFQREARVLASLSHQNIAAIHQVEEVDGCHFLVMELAEGEDLSARIRKAPLPPDEAMGVALQILEGLEAAHARGIVHRDLKPANVMLSASGAVKVLDFGLAKAWDAEAGESSGDLSMSPTLTAHMTQAGVILGTAAYMSPEQARGRPVDQRGDLWAFGCVLFEMLSGRIAFEGETVTDILGAIVHKEPDWSALPPATPRRVRRVLERCLAKDPRRRYHAAGDIRIDLTSEAVDAPGEAAGGARKARIPGWIWGLVAAAAILGLLAGRFLIPGTTPDNAGTRRYSLRVEPMTSGTRTLAVLPGGRTIIYPGGTPSMLRVRHRDRFESATLAGTEGASSAILSPDGEWVAFTAGSRIMKVRLDGSPPVMLHDFSPGQVNTSGGAWSSDGNIYISLWFGSDYGVLYRVPASGGSPEILVPRDSPEGKPMERLAPQLMPDGRHLLYTAIPGNKLWAAQYAEIRVRDLETGNEVVLMKGAGAGRYLASGHLLAAKGSGLFVVAPFDAGTFRTTGPAVPLAKEISTDLVDSALALFEATVDGTAVFLPAESEGGAQLEWLGLDGSRSTIADAGKRMVYPALSPDGRRISVVTGEQVEGQLEIYDLERRSFSALPTGGTLVASPVWAPDGKSLYYLGIYEGDEPGLYRLAVDGSLPAERVADTRTPWFYPISVSPDGRHLAAYIWDPDTETNWNISIMPTDGSGPPFGFQKEKANERWPRFSPDGRWLAFCSDRTGSDQVYIKRFPEQGGLYQISDGGGMFPIWTPDGKGLLYLAADETTVRGVTLELTDPPRISRPETVMTLPPDLNVQNWRFFGTLDPAGRRLLLIRNASHTADHLAVIENWWPELKKLAPPGR